MEGRGDRQRAAQLDELHRDDVVVSGCGRRVQLRRVRTGIRARRTIDPAKPFEARHPAQMVEHQARVRRWMDAGPRWCCRRQPPSVAAGGNETQRGQRPARGNRFAQCPADGDRIDRIDREHAQTHREVARDVCVGWQETPVVNQCEQARAGGCAQPAAVERDPGRGEHDGGAGRAGGVGIAPLPDIRQRRHGAVPCDNRQRRRSRPARSGRGCCGCGCRGCGCCGRCPRGGCGRWATGCAPGPRRCRRWSARPRTAQHRQQAARITTAEVDECA